MVKQEPRQRPWWRWLMPICMGFVLFANHFPRDVVGALEKQMESSNLVTSKQYAIMNSLYFLPNLITPIIAGRFMDSLGGINISFMISLVIGSVGHLLFSLGGQLRRYEVMLIGRCLAGTMYEIIDALMPVVYLSQYFENEWSITAGILTLLMRAGSIVNFVVTPIVLEQVSLTMALWVASFVSLIGILALLISLVVEKLWLSGSNTYDTVPTSETTITPELSPTNASEIELNHFGDSFDKLDEPDENTEDVSGVDSKSFDSEGINAILNKYNPLRKFSSTFRWYMALGVCIYGFLIPFWFIGSEYLQNSYSVSVVVGDALILIPEAVIMVIALPMGIWMDRKKWTLSHKISAVGWACVLIGFSYIALVLHATEASKQKSPGIIAPLIIVITIGIGFSVATSVFWGSFKQALPSASPGGEDLTAYGGGLLSGAVNILPTLLPPLLAFTFGSESTGSIIVTLAMFAFLGAAAAYSTVSDANRCAREKSALDAHSRLPTAKHSA